MKIRFKKIEERKKRATNTKYALFSILYFLFSFSILAQDSIPAASDLSEEKELKFQQFFFKALAEKSITNYQKAIENLEDCNQLLPNNVAVFFEFSKNYLLLNNTMLAKEYINRAISQEPNDVWMLEHLVEIHKKDRNFKKAIIVQEKIINLNPKTKSDLIYLYLSNREYDKTIKLLEEIKLEKGLTQNLLRIQNGLLARNIKPVEEKKLDESLEGLIKEFENEKSFEILKKIFAVLEKNKNNSLLENFSEKGISLFPAQPLVYLINGESLNNQQKFATALASLKNGIDFVIEDKMEADFYTQMAIASKGIGNANDEKKYRDLAKKLKS